MDEDPSSEGTTAEPAPESEPQAEPQAAPAGRKRRLRKVLLRSLIAFVVLAALAVVGGTYYYDHVALPDDIRLEQQTTIYYADGATPLARIGPNRTSLAIEQIPVDVQHAVVAAEDPSFYSNDGVDYGEVVGVAWNHTVGDGRRGGSTISQQYARQWADLEGVSYSRKLRESVIALKLNEQYSKDQILQMYLNIVYFGRGAYGIEAAAQAFFGKPAKDLTLAEGMVLAGLIDSPEGDSGRGSPFDPTVDATRAKARFDDIKRRMVELGFVAPAEAEQKMALPSKVLTAAQTRAAAVNLQGLDKPGGLIVHHVLGEVAALTDPKTGALLYEDTDKDGKKNFDQIRTGGLKIVTTIDQTVQRIAIREASRTAESNMDKQPANLQAALVAVEPGSGAVKAYYGGDTGTGNDYAGFFNDPVLGDGRDSCCGGHPPGATFNVYTLATGLINGYSTDSHWNGESPQDFPSSGRTVKSGNPVRNVGEGALAAPPCASGSAKWCTLDESAVLALNVPFFALAEKAGPAQVIDTARAAGLTSMWTTTMGGTPQKIDLTRNDGKAVFPKYLGTEVALGQYPVTVLEHAGGLATFAARGLAARTHFLKEVWTDGRQTYVEAVKPTRVPGFTQQMGDDLNAVLQGVPLHYNLRMHDARQVAGVAGTWQLGPTQDTAHAWMAGYTAYDPEHRASGLAVAVWVGNKAEEQRIVDKEGRAVIGGGLPGAIWRDFLDGALTETKAPMATFPPRQGTGDQKVGTGVAP